MNGQRSNGITGGMKVLICECPSQPQDVDGQKDEAGANEVALLVGMQPEGGQRAVPQGGEGQREAEEHREADRHTRERGQGVRVRVVVQDIPVVM